LTPEIQKTVVSSWNEWDPLKHIILGRADGAMIQAPEIAVQRDWPEEGFPLGKYGFEVVPVPFYKVSPFGSGLHCCTADVFREGTCEDYFLKQIEGY
jgi:hypothetical protein